MFCLKLWNVIKMYFVKLLFINCNIIYPKYFAAIWDILGYNRYRELTFKAIALKTSDKCYWIWKISKECLHILYVHTSRPDSVERCYVFRQNMLPFYTLWSCHFRQLHIMSMLKQSAKFKTISKILYYRIWFFHIFSGVSLKEIS